ncbi:MAG: ABC transporter ATP-binding protein [Acidobacteriota bacterium]
MSEPAVSAGKLTKCFGSFTAVDAIDFAIRAGECFGFLGPNGAGKTSTMRMIYGFSPVTDGELNVLGYDVKTEIRSIKCRLGVIPQEDNLDPDLKVLQNLIVYARYFDIKKAAAVARAHEVLEFVQLWERREEHIRFLSGGMKRRLTIGRALMNEPEILIADEPTTGLDPQARHLVWQKLRQLQSEGVTLVLTTHTMDEAAHLCDRVAIMDQGKILDIGTPSELIDKYVLPEVVEVRVAVGRMEPLIMKLQQLSLEFDAVGDVAYIYARQGGEWETALSSEPGVDRLVRRRASLEDVFLKLTGRVLRD